jgi:hypothetical protein
MTRIRMIACVLPVAALLVPAPAQARAAGCGNVTVNAGEAVGNLTVRAKRKGSVSCAKVRSLIRGYHRRIATGKCGSNNNFCWIKVDRNWLCGIYSYGLSQERGGAMSFCADQRKGGPSFLMFKALPPNVFEHGEFRSPDGRVLCLSYTGQDDEISCHVFSSPGAHSGFLTIDGNVRLCRVEVQSRDELCTMNPGSGQGPILKVGQRVERNGFRCVSAADGITCTVLEGDGQGKGFRINADGVAQVP